MTNTMTKRDYFNLIKDTMSGNADVVAFCDHEIALLDKKAASAKKAPKKVDTLIDSVYGALTVEPQTIEAIATSLGISNAKATPRLNKLVESGKAVKGTIKVEKAKRTVYSLVG